MSQKRVFLGVGHGGNDPGAVANGLKESYINLTVALEVDAILKAHNVIVMLSRYKEENDDLAEEIREANAFKPDVAVDIHVNAGGGDGFEAFYSIDQNYTKGVDKTLASNIEAEVKAIGQNSRGLKTKMNDQGRDYFGFIRSVNSPSIIIEMAFIDNLNDIKDFDEVHEQKRYALAVAKGILKTLGIAYKAPSTPAPTGATPYRVRKSWADASSQKGAFNVLEYAITECKKYVGYSVYDNTGKTMFTNGQAPAPAPTPTPPPAPQPSCDKEIKRYGEKGKCTVTTTSGIKFRDKPCTCHGVVQEVYKYKESVNYDLVVITDKYTWVSWIGASTGKRRYMPITDRKKNEKWATCV